MADSTNADGDWQEEIRALRADLDRKHADMTLRLSKIEQRMDECLNSPNQEWINARDAMFDRIESFRGEINANLHAVASDGAKSQQSILDQVQKMAADLKTSVVEANKDMTNLERVTRQGTETIQNDLNQWKQELIDQWRAVGNELQGKIDSVGMDLKAALSLVSQRLSSLASELQNLAAKQQETGKHLQALSGIESTLAKLQQELTERHSELLHVMETQVTKGEMVAQLKPLSTEIAQLTAAIAEIREQLTTPCAEMQEASGRIEQALSNIKVDIERLENPWTIEPAPDPHGDLVGWVGVQSRRLIGTGVAFSGDMKEVIEFVIILLMFITLANQAGTIPVLENLRQVLFQHPSISLPLVVIASLLWVVILWEIRSWLRVSSYLHTKAQSGETKSGSK